ncbi:MAG: undecaprenyl-diphosphate phosphatase [Bacteroidales bacterium]
MDILQTIILGIVEGLTEFLPVSSTGHMIIAQKFLGIESTDFVKAFTVIIQFGAILSVVVLYWKRFFKLNHCTVLDNQLLDGKSFAEKIKLIVPRFLYKYDFYWKLFIAFLPAAFFGFIFGDIIDSFLENIYVVSIMLILGGIIMLYVDKWFNNPSKDQTITNKKALAIGFYQCIAMIPGVSRSMATIVGGMTQRLTRKDAAEFSFFLAVPTMFAATVYKLLKLMLEPGGMDILKENMSILLIGNLVAFVVAMLAIKFFIGYVTRYGFKAFGVYRIILGIFLLVLLLMGYNLEII